MGIKSSYYHSQLRFIPLNHACLLKDRNQWRNTRLPCLKFSYILLQLYKWWWEILSLLSVVIILPERSNLGWLTQQDWNSHSSSTLNYQEKIPPFFLPSPFAFIYPTFPSFSDSLVTVLYSTQSYSMSSVFMLGHNRSKAHSLILMGSQSSERKEASVNHYKIAWCVGYGSS